MISLHVNGKVYQVDVSNDTPLLWVLRDNLNLKGTKYSCGIGECGSCTVHVDGKAVRSCTITAGEVIGHKQLRRFPAVTAQRVRLVIDKASAPPVVAVRRVSRVAVFAG